ncbi:MAG: hypothetical protein EZS28_032931 [Streblomastix strix]|uniref:Uncharacterized protein n=1 Tax=Streblomastix strix TaxID=222440 RepID=A0A5J4UNC8_9EUKA|nr:MAG: hypothetical protein EZS28_032931 [Streblomastix strix]
MMEMRSTFLNKLILQLKVQMALDSNLYLIRSKNNLKMDLNKIRVNWTQTIFQISQKLKAQRSLHMKLEGAKRIKAAQNHALNLPVRRKRATDSANFASGRHMLMWSGGINRGSNYERLLLRVAKPQYNNNN